MDWADEIAKSIDVDDDRFPARFNFSGDTRRIVAAALRKAKADGMKEAAEYISTLDYRVHVRELNARASQIEKGN